MVHKFGFGRINGFQGLPVMKSFLLLFLHLDTKVNEFICQERVAARKRKSSDRFSYLWMWKQFRVFLQAPNYLVIIWCRD